MIPKGDAALEKEYSRIGHRRQGPDAAKGFDDIQPTPAKGKGAVRQRCRQQKRRQKGFDGERIGTEGDDSGMGKKEHHQSAPGVP